MRVMNDVMEAVNCPFRATEARHSRKDVKSVLANGVCSFHGEPDVGIVLPLDEGAFMQVKVRELECGD